MTYILGSVSSAEQAMDFIKKELENVGLGDEKTLANINLISKEYQELWKPITPYFYLELDKKWKDNKHYSPWVRMYEKLKEDMCGRSEDFEWRWSGNELEVKRLEHL